MTRPALLRIGPTIIALASLLHGGGLADSPAESAVKAQPPAPSGPDAVVRIPWIEGQPRPAEGLVWINPGTFMMGSPKSEEDRENVEGPQTLVTISHGFWMGVHEVTQREYAAVMGKNPSQFKGDQLPVEQVSWYEATNYCTRLTVRERAAGRLPDTHVYRLPTEAEWEYACRAGTTTRFSFGDDPGYVRIGKYAWIRSNSSGRTHPVGQKLPNAWGLYDMYGNVFEWCSTWYAPYPGGQVTDPKGPPKGSNRAMRGGSWLYSGGDCRSANRCNYDPSDGLDDYFGLRVVVSRIP